MYILSRCVYKVFLLVVLLLFQSSQRSVASVVVVDSVESSPSDILTVVDVSTDGNSVVNGVLDSSVNGVLALGNDAANGNGVLGIGAVSGVLADRRSGRDRVLLRRHTTNKEDDVLASTPRVLTKSTEQQQQQYPHPQEIHLAKRDGISVLSKDMSVKKGKGVKVTIPSGNKAKTDPHPPLPDPPKTAKDDDKFLPTPPCPTPSPVITPVTPQCLPITQVFWTIDTAPDHGATPQYRQLNGLSASSKWSTDIGIHGEINDELNGHHRGLQTTNYPSPMMNQHVGGIMSTVKTLAIFWGTSWTSTSGKNKIAGLDAFHNGYSSATTTASITNYANIPNEYTSIPSTHTYLGHYVDTTTSSSTTNNVLNEICKIINKFGLYDLGGNNGPYYFPVYIDKTRPSSTNYCAYHSAGYCNAYNGYYQVFQFAFFYKVDSDPGCSITGYGGSSGTSLFTYNQALNSLVNLSCHELTEMRTDAAFIVGNNPNNWYFSGWYDQNGAEIGDKCAWSFPSPATFPEVVSGITTYPSSSTFTKFPSTIWQVQGEWSNNAYLCSTSSGCPTGITLNPTAYIQGCIGAAP